MKPTNLARQCPRFQSCSVNRCPLDFGYLNQFVHPDDKDKRCTMEKSVRVRIATTELGWLDMDGLTAREAGGLKAFGSLTLAQKSDFIKRGKDRLTAFHHDKSMQRNTE